MNKLIALTLLTLSLPVDAALLERAGGLAYYDDVLGITWVADADLAATDTFGVPGVFYWWRGEAHAGTWPVAQEWIAALNASGYLGVNDWRLPVLDPNDPGGASNEMLHLYNTIQPVLVYDEGPPAGVCSGDRPWCLTHTEPFANVQPYPYWLGTESGPNGAWAFHIGSSSGQGPTDKLLDYFLIWPVRDGDIGVVPAPASVWLLGTALGAVALRWRKRGKRGAA